MDIRTKKRLCGYKEYDDSRLPFDPSLMVYFRKWLASEILGESNEMVLGKAEADEQNTADEADDKKDDDDRDKNNGTMIVDVTCAPSQIKYPQDPALLNEARENTEQPIDTLHTPGEKKPRTYRRRAHKNDLALARMRNPGRKKIRKAIRRQLSDLSRNLKCIDDMLNAGERLTVRQCER